MRMGGLNDHRSTFHLYKAASSYLRVFLQVDRLVYKFTLQRSDIGRENKLITMSEIGRI